MSLISVVQVLLLKLKKIFGLYIYISNAIKYFINGIFFLEFVHTTPKQLQDWMQSSIIKMYFCIILIFLQFQGVD